MAQPGNVLVWRSLRERRQLRALAECPFAPYICAMAPVSNARWAGVKRSRCRWTDATSFASSEAW